MRGPVVSTKSADQKNKETEAVPVDDEQKDEKKSSKGRKSLRNRSPMREKVRKSPTIEKVEDDTKKDEPKNRLGVEKKPRQKSRSPGHQRSGSPKKALKKTEKTGDLLREAAAAAEEEKPKKSERGSRGKGGKVAPKVNSGRSSQNKARSPSPQLPVKTDQEKFEELFLVRRMKLLFPECQCLYGH